MQAANLTEFEYNNIVFKSGLNYLVWETYADDEMLTRISKKPQFWEFWTKLVQQRNEVFVKKYSNLTAVESRLIYVSMLDAVNINQCNYDWSQGFNQVISSMIHTL